MKELPQAVQDIFGVDELAAFRMCAMNLVENKVRAASNDEIKLLNSWLGSVFAIAEHERRRRRA